MACITECWEFFPGESKTLEINLVTYNSAHDCSEPFQISTDAGRKIEVTIPGEPDDLVFDLLSTPAVIVVDEKLGKIKINLTSANTNLMRSGSVVVKHDALGDSSSVQIATAINVVKKQKVPTC